ncbi:MAG: DNA translocase FtsK 4TM domain-containing protein [Myxococcota bacterium]
MARAQAGSSRGRGGKRAREEETSFAARAGAEAAGFSLLLGSLVALLALATYDPADPVFQLVPVANRAGVVGATLAGWLFAGVGYGSVVLVAAGAWVGGRLCLQMGLPGWRSRFWVASLALLISIASLPPILDQLAPGELGSPEGGWLGTRLAGIEQLLLSSWGALLVNSLVALAGTLGLVGISLGTALAAVGSAAQAIGSLVARVGAATASVAQQGFAAAGAGLGAAFAWTRGLGARVEVWRERRARRERVARHRDPDGEAQAVPEPELPLGEEAAPSPRARRPRAAEPDIVDHAVASGGRSPEQEAFQFSEDGPSGPFVLPDVSIFARPPDGGRSYDRDSLLMNSRILEKKLQDFGVSGSVVRVHPGPVITMYEYEPAAGVKVNKIVGLSDDLAMALRALSIRIIAPIPGKSVVGIEVPNPERETVYIRELLESDGFRSKSGRLTLAMGKDIFGNAVEADLAKMPHVLVAGATGTGKSVFLNSLLCSLLCRCRPEELKLLLIDPKLLELSIYDGIPHLIAEVVTNPKRAAAALRGVLLKMEERYQMMSACQVRNIDQYNELVDRELAEGNTTFRLKPKGDEAEGVEVEYRRLPYIVVVIDELADLMVTAAKSVEESLQRLAQMARAAGIHLVLATQRPSVDVLTGVIKANFPSRVSFQVSSRTDSRTILDQNGADALLGQGDMLFLPPGTSKLQRLHGPFVSETEVAELVAFLREQGRPEFDESLIRSGEESEAPEMPSDEEVDEMFDHAVAIVAETRNASISYIQRRLKIGYNRAARIVEQMEIQGMVGPQEGTRPREVFLRKPDEDDE